MYLDIKSTIWERIEFDNKEQMNDVVEKLKSGELISGSDVADYLNRGSELMEETVEEMSVEENGGFSTLEITESATFSDVYKNGL